EASYYENVQSDWEEMDDTKDSFIWGKPDQVNFNVYNQNKADQVTVSGTSKTSILQATTGSLNVPSYNKDDSFIGSLSGVFNSTSGSDKITVYFSIGNREYSTDISTTETGNIPFRIDYEINFPIAREANVSGIITLGKE